jgi:hypothetical protein
MRRETGPRVDGYASLLTGGVALAPGWERLSWAATRGSTSDIPERSRAVRAGALTTAIDVSVKHGDSTIIALAEQMAALLSSVPGAGDVASTYRDMSRRARVPVDQARRARIAARGVVSPPAFDNGAWLEAARLAAMGHDSVFFDASASRTQLVRLEGDATANALAGEDLRSMGQSIDKLDWDAIAVTTTNILARLAAP